MEEDLHAYNEKDIEVSYDYNRCIHARESVARHLKCALCLRVRSVVPDSKGCIAVPKALEWAVLP